MDKRRLARRVVYVNKAARVKFRISLPREIRCTILYIRLCARAKSKAVNVKRCPRSPTMYKRRSSTHNTLTDCSGYKRTQVAGRWRPKVVPKAKHATVPCGLYGMRRCALDREQVIDLAKLCLLVERGHACVGDQKLPSRFVWRNRPRLEAEAAAGARRGPAWVRPVGGPIERKPGGLACGEPPSLKHSGRKPGWPPARVVERWQASCSTERRAGGAHCRLALRAAAQVEAAPIDRAHYTALGS